jgi:hypothetical protein
LVEAVNMSSQGFRVPLRISLDGLKFLIDVQTLIKSRPHPGLTWRERILVQTSDDESTMTTLQNGLLWALSHHPLEQIRYELGPASDASLPDISTVRITLYPDKKGRVDISGDGIDGPGVAAAIRQLVRHWSVRRLRWIRRLPRLLVGRLDQVLIGVVITVLGGLLLRAMLR